MNVIKCYNNILLLSELLNQVFMVFTQAYLSKAKPTESGNFIFDEKSNSYKKSLNQTTNFILKINKQFEKKHIY